MPRRKKEQGLALRGEIRRVWFVTLVSRTVTRRRVKGIAWLPNQSILVVVHPFYFTNYETQKWLPKNKQKNNITPCGICLVNGDQCDQVSYQVLRTHMSHHWPWHNYWPRLLLQAISADQASFSSMSACVRHYIRIGGFNMFILPSISEWLVGHS